MKRWLSINRCPEHSDFWSISIDSDSGGTRLTSAKCCGRWHVVKRFEMTPEKLRDIATELECEADQMRREAGK